MRSATRRSLFAVAALAATTGFNVTLAWGQVNCGDTVTEKVAMTADLTCTVEDPGFTVAGGASVDMAGHRLIACAGCDGVALAGQGAKLSNGSIFGSPGQAGLILGGSGVHKVENVVVVGADTGFVSTSDKNKLRNCAAYGAIVGFSISGAKNALSRCHSSGSTSINFVVIGDNNNLTENTSADAGLGANGGILVSGNANKLSRNSSNDDDASLGAIDVAGSENKLSLNTVNGSGNFGLRVAGSENKVSKTVSTNSSNNGIQILGATNKLSKNAAYDSGGNGILIAGNGNNVNGSNASNNLGAGINVSSGDANSLKSNVAMHNTGNGVLVASGVTNSSIGKTVALGNTDVDLQDDNMNCGTNAWAKSVFGSREAGGIADHSCIQ